MKTQRTPNEHPAPAGAVEYIGRQRRFMRTRTHLRMHELIREIRRVRQLMEEFVADPKVRADMERIYASYEMGLLDDIDKATWPLMVVASFLESAVFPDRRFPDSV